MNLLYPTLLFFTLISNTLFAYGGPIRLEVIRIKNIPVSYQDFCNRNQGECDLGGTSQIIYNSELLELLQTINTNVNQEIKFELDTDQYNSEEFWNYPISGSGDCEDNALEKRRRLVEAGLPRGAIRMMTAFHNMKFYGHALLSIETTQGTLILDQDSEKILFWDQAPYILEARETTDGKWERFEQNW